MKKLLSTLALAALTSSAFAQGTVIFGNNTGLVQQWTSTANSAVITVPKKGGEVELIAANTGASLQALGTLGASGFSINYQSLEAFLAANSAFTAVATTPITSLSAGVFGGGTVTINNINPAGFAAEYIIIGWTGTYTSLDAALAADATTPGSSFIGESALFTTTTANPLSSPPGTAGSLNATFGGVVLAPLAVVPEPATFALAGLGIAALLVFRRRN